jgi:hypothetical protein
MSPRLVLTLIAATALAGCSSTTAPMSCDGNPKCKADSQPSVHTTLTLNQSPPIVARSSPKRLTK